MSDNKQTTNDYVTKGQLPPLPPQPSSSNSVGGSGTQQSQRGQQNTTFGLQSLNEGVKGTNNK